MRRFEKYIIWKIYKKKNYAYILCMKLVVCTKTRAYDNEQYIILYKIIYTHGIVHFSGLMRDCTVSEMSNIREGNGDTAFRCMRKERPSSVRWCCLIFFSLSMNQPRLYRRLIIAKQLKCFFSSFFISRIQSFDVRADRVQCRIMYRYTPSFNSHHITSPCRPPTVSHRSCTDNVGVKHDKSAGVVHQTPAVVIRQWSVRLRIPLANCAAWFVFCLYIDFRYRYVYSASKIMRQTNKNAYNELW